MFEKETAQIEAFVRDYKQVYGVDPLELKWCAPCSNPNIPGTPQCGAVTKGKLIPKKYQSLFAGRAQVYLKVVLPRITNAYNYAICLHELGHVYTASRDEITANRWARKHALYWNQEMTNAALDGMQTYVRDGLISHNDYFNFKWELESDGKKVA